MTSLYGKKTWIPFEIPSCCESKLDYTAWSPFSGKEELEDGEITVNDQPVCMAKKLGYPENGNACQILRYSRATRVP